MREEREWNRDCESEMIGLFRLTSLLFPLAWKCSILEFYFEHTIHEHFHVRLHFMANAIFHQMLELYCTSIRHWRGERRMPYFRHIFPFNVSTSIHLLCEGANRQSCKISLPLLGTTTRVAVSICIKRATSCNNLHDSQQPTTTTS